MALKIVDTASLDAVANALNESAGTSGAISFPDGFVEKIGELSGNKLAQRADGTITEITEKDLYGAKTIIGKAFYNCRLKKISLPDSITTIAEGVFDWCTDLETVKLPKNLISIREASFRYCRKLREIELPDTLTSIGYEQFFDCWVLPKLDIPNGITEIPAGFVWSCKALKIFDLTAYGQDKSLPTLANVNAFNNTPTDMKIIVPHGKKATLAAMTNWSSFADKIVDDIKGNWIFNDSVGTADIDKTFNIKGVYDGKEFSTIRLGLSGYNYIAIDGEQIHDSGMWFGSKEIIFTQSYADIEDGVELMTWLNANATVPRTGVSNETDTSGIWELNSTLVGDGGYWQVNGFAGGNEYKELTWDTTYFYVADYENGVEDWLYDAENGGWYRDEDKTIIIYDSVDIIENGGALLDWLNQNGIKTSQEVP